MKIGRLLLLKNVIARVRWLFNPEVIHHRYVRTTVHSVYNAYRNCIMYFTYTKHGTQHVTLDRSTVTSR